MSEERKFADMVGSYDGGIGKKKKVLFNTSTNEDYFTKESYKTLRTNLIFCGKDIKTIAITSYGANEGKSTISSELSKNLAEAGYKTLLIDADMRKSVMLKKNSQSQQVEGLSEAPSDLKPYTELIYGTQYDKFDVMFSGHFPPMPVELIGNGIFEKMLKELNQIYDYIIIDTPPLGLVIDAAVISSYCDGAILVIADRRVNRKEALEVKKQIENSGCKILGTVINEIDKKSTKYYRKEYSKKYYQEYK